MNTPQNTPPANELSGTETQSADLMKALRDEQFREPIQELENLLSQPRRAFLLGAGCSVCAGLPMMNQLTGKVQESLTGAPSEILKSIRAHFGEAPRVTIEDYMSELVDHISLAERRDLRQASNVSITLGDKQYSHAVLKEALKIIKSVVAQVITTGDGDKRIETHRKFIKAVHGTLKSGKTAMAYEAVDYFTLNYDTLLEDALALERVPLADGFIGGTTAWWHPEEYRDSRMDAKLYKLHGSIDWSMCNGDVFPRRIRHGLTVPERHENVLIWPAATKYREAQRDPYAQLLAYFRDSLRPCATSQTILCICGYAFADEHINIEIERALRDSGDRLTVVVLTSDPEPTGQLATWRKDAAFREQIRVYANRGFFHGDDVRRADHDLAWWKFEILTRLLSGSR